MPDDPRESMDDVMEQARRQFISAARGTVEAFEQFGVQLAEQPDAAELLTSLRRELHRLNGSAGTFGFPRIGRMAAALESAVKRWDADPALDRDRRAQIVVRFVSSLREQLATDVVAPVLPGRRLLLVGLKDAVAVPITTEAAARGYQVERVASAELAEALEDGMPHAVIAADTVLGLGELTGVARLALKKRETGETTGPLVGGVRTLDIRTEPRELLDVLDVVADRERDDGAGVLAVDDDPVMRTIVKVACEHMNLAVTTVADGDAFRAALRDMSPALFVIDVDLGAASGLDLVRVARERASVVRSPVLVLSGHADAGTRDAAFAAGADDYMLKPFVPAEFQRRVTALLESERRRLANTGIHAASGLSLPSRTIQDFEAALASRVREATTVALLGPVTPPASAKESAAWHRECARIGAAAHAEQATVGLVDDTTVGIISARDAAGMLKWLAAQAALAPPGATRWVAGVVAVASKGANASLHSLLAAASAARSAARDDRTGLREWDPTDADIAPDVVVIEDDIALADLIVFALDTKGLSHRHFADGVSALNGLRAMRVRGARPIVLLDVDLPGLDGHSLHEQIRIERPGQFDIVFVSGKTSEAEQLRGIQAGALDYIVKPVSLRVLVAKVAGWRSRSRGP